jgi:hypothetical protein
VCQFEAILNDSPHLLEVEEVCQVGFLGDFDLKASGWSLESFYSVQACPGQTSCESAPQRQAVAYDYCLTGRHVLD